MSILYHCYNKNGDKISVTGKELQDLAKRGVITPETLIEVEGGKTVWAKGIKGLTFKSNDPQDAMDNRIAGFLNEPVRSKPTSKATDITDAQSVSLAELQRQSVGEYQREQEIERAALLERQERQREAEARQRETEWKIDVQRRIEAEARQREAEAEAVRRREADARERQRNTVPMAGGLVVQIGENCRNWGCSLTVGGFVACFLVGFIWGATGLTEGFLPIVWIVVGFGGFATSAGLILLVVGLVIPGQDNSN